MYALTRKVALAKSLMYAHAWSIAPTWTMAQHETMRRGAHTYEFYVNFESSYFYKIRINCVFHALSDIIKHLCEVLKMIFEQPKHMKLVSSRPCHETLMP